MNEQVKSTDWLNNHLYLSHKFNKELNDFGIERVADLEKLSLFDLLNFKTITVARLRNVIVFMHKHHLNFRTLVKSLS
jgi:hypothetical protein